MFCIKCGAKIPEDSRFCISCGERVTAEYSSLQKGFWPRKTSILLIILSIAFTSVVWWLFGGIERFSIEDESANIITHLIETIGRQSNAWDKTEQIIEVIGQSFSEECLYNDVCINEMTDKATALRAEVQKEKKEIDNLWTKEGLGLDFRGYFSKLGEKNLNKILDMLEIYFPEESEELEPSAKFL